MIFISNDYDDDTFFAYNKIIVGENIKTTIVIELEPHYHEWDVISFFLIPIYINFKFIRAHHLLLLH